MGNKLNKKEMINVKSLAKELITQTKEETDIEAIKITGNDTDYIFTITRNTRNNFSGENGKNRLSMKDYCKEQSISHRCIYKILKKQGIIEEKSPNNLVLLYDGFILVHKNYLPEYDNDNIFFPILTAIEGSLYVDDTHEYFQDFLDLIEKDEDFKDCPEYNTKLKNRKNTLPRYEQCFLSIYLEKQKEITDES